MRGGTMEMTESRELGLQDVPAVRYQSPAWGGIPGVVYVQVGCLVWLAVATTALSFTLARRSQRVLDLLDVRRRLVAESVHADERANRELSEQLHDGPLQSLLAARLELDELREHPSGSGFDHLDAALRDIVTALRTTVSTLHPQVLTEVGLSAAVTDLARRYEQRWGVPVSTEIEEMGRVPSQTLLYRAARELLANVTKHARATAVQVVLRRTASATVLIVADDGVGFDPAILSRRVAEGHIGLASLMVTVDAMGGILRHAPALLALTNPTTNSYKRLVPGYEAPVNLAYSQRNRSASCRIPMYSTSPKTKRIEFRCPDPTCNPYLSFSAILLAAIDGIQNKINPGEPLDRDIYDMPPEELANVPKAPGSLDEALDALERDSDFLLRGDVFTEDVIATWLKFKREQEIAPMRLRPHP
ncbi:MAG: hypothetical protein EBU23_09360, partial [Mycobacteriaceae bacterium]|nr:hypothetical protein [Mycobacteriaceae bacterium]